MTVTIDPSPETEAQLREEAAERNISVEDYCIELLRKALAALVTEQPDDRP